MDPSTGLGTIAVGSVTELANILTNMSPEQLQNVRLDPALYSALSQTIDPAPQTELYDIQNLNQHLLTQPQQVSTGLDMLCNQVVQQPNNEQSFNNQQQPNNQTFISQSIPLLTTTDQVQAVFLSPLKTDTIQIQQEQQQSQPVFLSNVNQHAPVTIQNVIGANPFVVQDLSQFQGILPGQASSLILTPTVMSQVQPTATVQTLKITDTQVLQAPLTATLDVSSQIATQSFMTPVQTLNLGNNLPTSLYPSTININPNMFTPSTFHTVDNNTFNSTALNTAPQNQQLVLNGNSVVANNLSTQQFLISGMVDTGHQVLLPDTGQQVVVNGLPQHTVLLPTQTISPSVTSCQQVIITNVSSNDEPKTVLKQQGMQAAQMLKADANKVAGTIILPNGKEVSLTPEQLTEVLKRKKVYTTQARNLTAQSMSISKITTKPVSTKKMSAVQNSSSNSLANSNFVVKTVNVISNSEAAEKVQMKPKSVEQVQPGVFKFQLTKVDNSDIITNEQVQAKTHKFHNYNAPKDIRTLPTMKHSNQNEIRKNIISTTSSVIAKTNQSEQFADNRENKSLDPTSTSVSQTKTYSGISTARLLEIARKINVKNQSGSMHTTPVIKSGQPNATLGKIKTPINSGCKTPAKPSFWVPSANSLISIKRPNLCVSVSSHTVKTKPSIHHSTNPIVAVNTKNTNVKNINFKTTSASSTALTSSLSTVVTPSRTISSISAQDTSPATIIVGAKLATCYPLPKPIKGDIIVKGKSKTTSACGDTTSSSITDSSSSQKRKREGSIEQELQKPLDHTLECEEQGFVSPGSDESNSPPKTKSTFNRSFKKSVVVLENLKSVSKYANNFSKEETEILSIRKAIKSSQVGGENAMRQLAKLEIENQLKRFSQKSQPMADDSKNGKLPSPVLKKKKISTSIRKDIKPTTIESVPQSSKLDTVSLSVFTKRIECDNQDKSQKTNALLEMKQNKGNSSSKIIVKKRKVSESNSVDTFKEETKPKKSSNNNYNDKAENEQTDSSCKTSKTQKRKNKINDVSSDSSVQNDSCKEIVKKEEDSRKRERPKRFDDFIFPVKAKKEKKTKKFFFPKENVTSVIVISDDNNFEFDTTENTQTSLTVSLDECKTTKVEDSSDNDAILNTTKSSIKQDGVSAIPANTNKKSKLNQSKKNRKRKKKENKVVVELEVLPGHLKSKPKITEDAVIDLSKIKLKSSFAESSYDLCDIIKFKTYKLLSKPKSVCTLCGKPGNIGSLDVLFGPYKLKVLSRDESKDIKMNVWMHRDCAIWTSSICLANQTLTGLGDALEAAAQTPCSLCSHVGATLECGFKQCRDGYHFVCAKQRGCSFRMDSFTIICPKHK